MTATITLHPALAENIKALDFSIAWTMRGYSVRMRRIRPTVEVIEARPITADDRTRLEDQVRRNVYHLPRRNRTAGWPTPPGGGSAA